MFQITQAAALICSQLPIPQSFDFIATLHDWQDLAGAVIGGLMGVTGALIVAARATRRERRIAASTVLPEVMSLRACNDEIDKAKKVSRRDRRGKARLVCDMLLRARPTLTTLHSPVITQLYDIDARVYSHLFHAHWMHEQFEPALERYREARNEARAPHASPDDAEAAEFKLDLQVAKTTWAWERSVEHATLANYYLDRFVFRRWPNWAFGLRMRYFPNDLDRRSKHLLETGSLLREPDASSNPELDPNMPI
ncbi:hypothetical protein [Paraburkholderia acidisoli]|uniref:Uncharacterized protein n=1 Tax=Paraburkholderia acidisoli TaxID=2571748 RepID=A0A7Z2JFM7_9BURK|nr:hypothetical protein [Paraburkholderia acidisoli]QGZ61659.1 hypothetical protein FAZ98_07865 [Paraburkholderia acidisoli]